MKAAVLHGNRDIRYEDYNEPQVASGLVKVHVRAAGICGSDVPRVLYNGAHFYPIVLGHEFSGDVVEIGEGVTTVAVGDTVSGVPLIPCMKCRDCQMGNFSLCKHYTFIGSRIQGAFADFVVLPEQNVVKYDATIPYEYAAMFEPSTVALHGVLQNEYKGGGFTAVVGGGTIGIFTSQWAKIFGSKKLVVFDIDDGRLSLAKRMGADDVINTTDRDFLEQAKAVTDGVGFDYVFEAVGNPATLHTAFDIASNKAHVCCIGTPHNTVSFTQAEWELMNRKEFYLTGSWMSYSAPFPGKEWELSASYLSDGRLKYDPAFIYKKYHLSQAAEAFAEFEHPENIHGKILLMND